MWSFISTPGKQSPVQSSIQDNTVVSTTPISIYSFQIVVSSDFSHEQEMLLRILAD